MPPMEDEGMARMEFRCVCGEPAHPPDLSRFSWATLAGYGTFQAITWHRDEESARRSFCMEGLLETRPEAGHSHWVGLSRSFASRRNEFIWCVFESPSMIFMGFDDSRCHLEDLLMVGCRVHRIQTIGVEKACGLAMVEATLSIADLLALPLVDPGPNDALWREFRPMAFEIVTRQGPLVLVEYDREGDCGAWALLHQTSEATELLMYSEWGAHEDHLWCGHLRLPATPHSIAYGLPPQFESEARSEN